MFILTNDMSVIVAIVDEVVRDNNGLLTTKDSAQCYYPAELTEIEVEQVPVNVSILTHRYIEGVFTTNPGYVAPQKTLQEQVDVMKAAIDELIMTSGGL